MTGANTSAVPTRFAPTLLPRDREFVDACHEIIPAECSILLSEKRIRDRFADIAGCAIVEQKPHVQILRLWERRRCRVREEFESHRGGVIWDPEKIAIGLCEICQAEERLETGVGTELDVQWCLAVGGDGGVQGFENLRGEGGACYCANGVGVVVG